MSKEFDEKKFLRKYLDAHPEFEPKPGYITKEGLISFAKWLIEEGYCKLGRTISNAMIQLVLSYLHSRKLFERTGSKHGNRPLYRINWDPLSKSKEEFLTIASEIEELITKEGIVGRKWFWVPRKAIERKAKQLGISSRKLVSVGVSSGLFKRHWRKGKIQAVYIWDMEDVWTKRKKDWISYHALRNTLKEQGYSLKDPFVAGLLKRLRRKLVYPVPICTE
jgi:hypothetical protein